MGDSGLGKSPLLYQAALCVSTGLPFLGLRVQRGRCVYLDFENSSEQSDEILSNLARYLGADLDSADLLVWNYTDCAANYGQPSHGYADLVREFQPAWVIIDSATAWYPEIEDKNSLATQALKKLRRIIRDCRTAFTLVHHIKKQSRRLDEAPPELEDGNLRSWFKQARGASALINGSDVRLGVDEPSVSLTYSKDGRLQSVGAELKGALVLRGFGRVSGEIPLMHLARVLDGEHGEPVGYRRMIGVELLFNQDQEQCFALLPHSFTFKEAKQAYGRQDQATRDFLNKCIAFGILQQPAKGSYAKTKAAE